jgi:hypothetical protein
MVISTPIRPLPSPAIELRIEELVLHGFAANDRFRIGAAIEQELRRLIVAGTPAGLPDKSVELDRLDAGAFQLQSNPSPRTVGHRVAQHVFAQLPPAQSAPPTNGGVTHV